MTSLQSYLAAPSLCITVVTEACFTKACCVPCMMLRVQVVTAVAAIEFSTRYSKACCKLMVDSSGVSALLAFMRSCNRSKPHVEMLGHALACLANICR